MIELLPAQFFDGVSARAVPVRLHVADGALHAMPDAVDEPAAARQWPLGQVQWPERTRHGQRTIALPGGERLLCTDARAFDAWAAGHGRREGWVVRAQQSWGLTLAALLTTVTVLAAGYVWGLPAAVKASLPLVPDRVDQTLGDAVLAQLDQRLLKPTELSPARQTELRAWMARAAASAFERGQTPSHRVEFRHASPLIGPNAFALPGGTIVITDALVKLLDDQPDALVGVFAHELGHVRHRHVMQSLGRSAVVATVAGALVGDFSTLLAIGPAYVADMAYSREFEREADAESVRVLLADARSPAAMAVFFRRIRTHGEAAEMPIALASHPPGDERIAYFERMARRR